MFRNTRGFNISGGQFNNVGRDQINNTTTHYHSTDRKPVTFQNLYEEVKDVGASYDSEVRYPQPRCHPDTRRDVLKLLLNWIHSDLPSDRILWLYGPAGAGKSAIAQTVAETAREENILVASFFFSRADSKRNNPKYIFLSIAYQLAHSIPELREPIERAIRKNPTILQSTLEKQFRELILEPCRSLPQLARKHQGILVVDGIDECNGSSAQQRILVIMATALSKGMPYRTLLCSRPELSIRESLDTEIFRLYLRRIALDDTFAAGRDIAILLNSEFKRIRESPRNCHIEFPNPWPSPSVVDELIQKASGQFIYADTVIKFVDNEYANPCTRLEIVLRPKSLSDPDVGSPFHDLDALYHQILSTNPHRSKLRDILRVLVLAPQIWLREPRSTPRNMEALLMLPEGEVLLTLRGMHSVLDINGPDDEIRILHASFGDSLLEEGRSGDFFVGNTEDQYGFVARRLLHAIDYYIQTCEGHEERLSQAQRNVLLGAWGAWGDCCSKSGLDDQTLDAIRNANFTRSLGLYIQQGIEVLSSTGLSTETSGIQRVNHWILVFFHQTERLLERLRVSYQRHTDIIQRLTDYRRGFCIKVTRQDIPKEVISLVLDATAKVLGCLPIVAHTHWLFTLRSRGLLPQTTRIPVKLQQAFEVISLGNDCGCTRKEDASCLSLPCSDGSTPGDVYHIQLSVAIGKLLAIMMRTPRDWSLGIDTHCLLVQSSGINSLCTLLDISGPSSECLDLLPPLLDKIKSKTDQQYLSRWLQSFSPRYASRTSPLIERVQKIQCEYP